METSSETAIMRRVSRRSEHDRNLNRQTLLRRCSVIMKDAPPVSVLTSAVAGCSHLALRQDARGEEVDPARSRTQSWEYTTSAEAIPPL